MYPVESGPGIVAYGSGRKGDPGDVSAEQLAAAIDAVLDGVDASGDTLAKLLALILLRAPLDGAALTNATTTTQAPGNNSNKLATTAFTHQEVINGTAGLQPLDALLTAISALTTSADKLMYFTGSDTVAQTTLTTFIRTLLDDPDAATALATLTAQGTAAKGVANGYAGLDSGGKVPTSQLPASVVGDVQYQGVWDANTNSPTIPAASSGNKGQYYVVGTSGSTTVDGVSEWKVGDWLVSNGTTWDKIDNTDSVSSVAGLIGAISAAGLKTALAIAVADITDASANGRSLISAANYAAMKTLLSLNNVVNLDTSTQTNVSFTGLTSAAAVADADTFPTNQGAANLKQTFAAVKTWIKSWIVKADVGLGSVPNTDCTTQANVSFTGLSAAAAAADADTFPTNQGASNLKQTLGAIKTWIKAWIVKGDVGLGNVDNTSDSTKNAAAVSLTNKILVSSQQLVGTGTGGGSAAPIVASGPNTPAFGWNFTGGAADQKNWDAIANATSLLFRAVDDANAVAASWMTVTRGAGASVSSVAIPAFAPASHSVSRAAQTQGIARSVIGVTGNATADVADIQGTANQFLGVNSAGTVLAFQTMSGDATLSGGAITITKTGGTNFAASATTDTTNAANISSGVLPNARLNFTVRPQGRLTLTSATPVMTGTVSGATTVYYTPDQGNLVPIYDGTNFTPTVFTELSQTTADTTKSPAAVAASKVYDLFVWNDSGTLRCTRGPAWTNDTTRGYTLTMVNGILLNTSAIGSGPGALRGTWVGTIRSNASSTIDYIFGAAASGGTAAFFGVWNTYNRRLTTTSVKDSGASYTYNSATIRQARASAGNQVTFVSGAAEDGINASYTQRVDLPNVGSAEAHFGVGLDDTTNFTIPQCILLNNSASGIVFSGPSSGMFQPQLGVHVVSGNEKADTNTTTFNVFQKATLFVALMN